MKIIGIDIGNGTAVCCPIEFVPSEPRQFNIDGANFYHFEANSKGIKGLLELKPDIAVLEPTGVNYSRLWGTHLARNGIEVRLVDHSALSSHRTNLDLPDKDDESDAFALAHYGLVNLENRRKFLQIRTETIVEIRKLILRLAHLNKVQSPIINRLRQDLAWQFPEISKRPIRRQGVTVPLMYRWLAGLAKSKRYDEDYSKTVGLGLDDSVKQHALRLCEIHSEEIKIEQKLNNFLMQSEFNQYRKVFTRFGFGFRLQAILISQIYPLENFLDQDGKQIVVFKKGRKSKNHTKRHLSRRRFEKCLGCAATTAQSGKKDQKSVIGGSDLCRMNLWLWLSTRVLPEKSRTNALLDLIYIWMKSPKRKGKPHRLLVQNTLAFTSRLLFKCLMNEFYDVDFEWFDYEVIKNQCQFCGAMCTSEKCDHCEKLKTRLDLFWK